MKNSLLEGSRSYYEQAAIYERFSEAEDAPGKVLQFLKPRVRNRIVLDVGCGTGKYARLLSRAKKYYGIDISGEQLKIARKNPGKFICCSAEKIPLRSSSVDVVISTWAISTILGDGRKSKAIKEALRILKPGGHMFVVENDAGGDFERIRGKWPRTEPKARITRDYLEWLSQMMTPAVKLKTYFGFSSLKEAKQIIGAIWGKAASDKVTKRKLGHNVIIFSHTKEP